MKCKNCGKKCLRKNNRQMYCKICSKLNRLKINQRYDKKRRLERKRKEWEKAYRKKQEVREKKILRDFAYYHLRKELFDEKKLCEICNSLKNLEIHHIKYSKNKEDCMVLCKKCHQKQHKPVFKEVKDANVVKE